jgi:hypothetical protein
VTNKLFNLEKLLFRCLFTHGHGVTWSTKWVVIVHYTKGKQIYLSVVLCDFCCCRVSFLILKWWFVIVYSTTWKSIVYYFISYFCLYMVWTIRFYHYSFISYLIFPLHFYLIVFSFQEKVVCLAASKSANLVFQVKKMLLLVRMNIFFCESVRALCSWKKVLLKLVFWWCMNDECILLPDISSRPAIMPMSLV